MSKHTPVSSNSRKAAKYRGVECLNCGHPLDLSDKYCPYCSQLNSTKQLSFTDFFSEFINSVVSYDSRLRYTVKDLLFKPGIITRNFIQGQRLKYANPFRFYLSVSIIYFIIQSFITFVIPQEDTVFNVNSDDKGNTEQTTDGNFFNFSTSNTKKSSSEKSTATDSISENNKKDTIPTEKPTNEIEYISEKNLDTLNWVNESVTRFSLYRSYYKKHKIPSAAIALDSLNHNNTMYNRWLYNKNEAVERVSNNPREFAEYLMKKIPFFIFFFTPFYALFFWLIYSKKKFNYISHIIFIFHVFSFLFLASIICTLPDLFFENDYFEAILISIVAPFYFYKALRNFYRQSRFITILKFVFLNVVFWIGASIASVLFFFVTAAVY